MKNNFYMKIISYRNYLNISFSYRNIMVQKIGYNDIRGSIIEFVIMNEIEDRFIKCFLSKNLIKYQINKEN